MRRDMEAEREAMHKAGVCLRLAARQLTGDGVGCACSRSVGSGRAKIGRVVEVGSRSRSEREEEKMQEYLRLLSS